MFIIKPVAAVDEQSLILPGTHSGSRVFMSQNSLKRDVGPGYFSPTPVSLD